MHIEAIHLLTLILGVGVGIQWFAAWLRIPSLLMLLAAGVLLGPVTGVLDPEEAFGELFEPLVHLAVALVLFEGGLSLHLHEARFAGKTLWRLILAGLFLGGSAVTLFAYYVTGLSLATSAVLGGILVVTGPTVILPMLRSARISLRPATLLKWEGIVNDPLGALLALFVFQAALLTGEEGVGEGIAALLLELVVHTFAGALLGALVGWALGMFLNRNWIPSHLKSPVILAAVLVVFAGADALREENGLLAVTAMGLVLANVEGANIQDIRHFKEQISTVLIAFLFIVLSARLDPASLQLLLGAPLVLVAAVLFLVRPLVGLAATIGSELPWGERALIGWIAPRGVVAAAVAGAFEPRLLEAGYEDASLLVPIVFGVIVATVILHGITLRPLAQKLGLGSVEGRGILLAGAPSWGIELAQALDRAGAFVVLADRRYKRVSKARREGLEVYYGDVLSQEAPLELPLERVTWVFALTDDDAYNSLVCSHFAREFDEKHVLQLMPSKLGAKTEMDHHMMGRTPWDRATHFEITSRHWRGGAFKVTTTSEEFGWEVLQESQPGALFLFYVDQGRLMILEEDKEPPIGSKVIYLTAEAEADSATASG